MDDITESIETKELPNQSQVVDYRRLGPVTFGPWTSHIWRSDPRHLLFLLSRYKFVAKMLTGRDRVLEIGCGDATGMNLVLQTVRHVHGVDCEPLVLADACERYRSEGFNNATFSVHDMTECHIREEFEAAYALDVIEHIERKKERTFIKNIVCSLTEHGVLILGTPNITASKYASEKSCEAHVNLKSAEDLCELLAEQFQNVFLFSMNDEILHTGFAPMAHYLLGMGVGLKSRP